MLRTMLRSAMQTPQFPAISSSKNGGGRSFAQAQLVADRVERTAGGVVAAALALEPRRVEQLHQPVSHRLQGRLIAGELLADLELGLRLLEGRSDALSRLWQGRLPLDALRTHGCHS